MPTAARAASTLAVVESSGVDIVRGEARVTIRFTADDPVAADSVARRTVAGTEDAAQVLSWRLTERIGSRWRTLV